MRLRQMHLTEFAIVRIGWRALRCLAKFGHVLLPHILQECKGYAPAKLLRMYRTLQPCKMGALRSRHATSQ